MLKLHWLKPPFARSLPAAFIDSPLAGGLDCFQAGHVNSSKQVSLRETSQARPRVRAMEQGGRWEIFIELFEIAVIIQISGHDL